MRQHPPISCVFIDELGRASRDHVEALSLGRLVERSSKRLIGVSDGFDSQNPMSKIMLSIFSMLHELFVDQLREKVDRGMNDAFAQGKHLYKPAFGYALEPILGENGEPMESPDGKMLRQVVIVPEEAEQVRRAFRLYADDGWSPQRIGRLFNEERVDDREKWSDSLIRTMIQRHTYHGREAWGRTTKQADPKTGVVKTVKMAQSDWKWRDVPNLRIVDEETWDRAQARMERLSRAYNPRDNSITRGEGHPKRLFHLFCKCSGVTPFVDTPRLHG